MNNFKLLTLFKINIDHKIEDKFNIEISLEYEFIHIDNRFLHHNL